MSTIIDNPRVAYAGFYNNPAITTLADASRWTVSGRLGDDAESKGKAPIDIRHLFDVGRVRGAWAQDDQCLVTLDELARRLPDAANHAFYLRAVTDGLMVIDIEPSCPVEISTQLLALPGVIYSETSMSGRGFHLATPLPASFHEFRVASGKRVLREQHGWYELLLDHWVTFTRKPISEDIWKHVQGVLTPASEFASTATLFASLAETARATTVASTTVRTSVEAPKITGGQDIVSRTLEGAWPRFKTLDDFDGDASRWEFSVLGVLYREMHRHLVRVGFLRRTTYDDSDRAWLLFQTVQEVLPDRPKHSEQRNGRPFLLDRAAAMVAANATNKTARPKEMQHEQVDR